jgi:hypothetical protein
MDIIMGVRSRHFGAMFITRRGWAVSGFRVMKVGDYGVEVKGNAIFRIQPKGNL